MSFDETALFSTKTGVSLMSPGLLVLSFHSIPYHVSYDQGLGSGVPVKFCRAMSFVYRVSAAGLPDMSFNAMAFVYRVSAAGFICRKWRILNTANRRQLPYGICI